MARGKLYVVVFVGWNVFSYHYSYDYCLMVTRKYWHQLRSEAKESISREGKAARQRRQLLLQL